MSQSFTFIVFTKKQQSAIDYISDVHMLHRDDINCRISLYMVNKLVTMGVLDYDSESDVWDFTNRFFNHMVAFGMIELTSGNRTYKTWDQMEAPAAAAPAAAAAPEHKAWTPRKTLIVHAAHHAIRNKLTSWLAIEEIIQDWQQKKMCQKSRDYYAGLSHVGQLRLITDVKNHVAQNGGGVRNG